MSIGVNEGWRLKKEEFNCAKEVQTPANFTFLIPQVVTYFIVTMLLSINLVLSLTVYC